MPRGIPYIRKTTGDKYKTHRCVEISGTSTIPDIESYMLFRAAFETCISALRHIPLYFD